MDSTHLPVLLFRQHGADLFACKALCAAIHTVLEEPVNSARLTPPEVLAPHLARNIFWETMELVPSKP